MLRGCIALLAILGPAGCEWVEISQQHYHKPIRPSHTHPLLAITETYSEPKRPTHQEHPIQNRKVSEIDRANKGNRIYINHSLQDLNWNTGGVKKVPSEVNGVKPVRSVIVSEEHDDAVTRRPLVSDNNVILHETNDKGDILITRRPKPEMFLESDKRTVQPTERRTSIAGNVNRVRPTNTKKTPKPIEEYQESIEVLNLSDLEYTAEDSMNVQLDKADTVLTSIMNTSNTTPKGVHLRKSENQFTTPEYTPEKIKPTPNQESNTKLPTLMTGTSMRRVEILPTTKVTKDITHKPDKSEDSPNFESVSDERKVNMQAEIAPYKFPNIGHVKRVQIKSNSTRTSLKPKPQINNQGITEITDQQDVSTKHHYEVQSIVQKSDKSQTLQWRSTTEKPFPVRTKLTSNKYLNRSQGPKAPSPEEVMLEEIVTSEAPFDVRVHKVASIGTIKRVSNPTKEEKPRNVSIDRENKNSEPFSEVETEKDGIVEDEDPNDQFNEDFKIDELINGSHVIPPVVTKKAKPKNHTNKQPLTSTRKPDTSSQIERNVPDKISEKMPGLVTQQEHIKDYKTEVTSNKILKNKLGHNSVESQGNRLKYNSVKEHKPEKQSNEDSDRKEKPQDPLTGDNKQNAIESLIKFLKTVTEIIARNARRGVHGKMRYLEYLRDTILANLEERLDAEFPDDDAPRRHRRSAEARGHYVEFPSSEGALMTISFLTFAVFLIKLVLQVIQAYKNKTMVMMPTMVAAMGRAYNEHRARN